MRSRGKRKKGKARGDRDRESSSGSMRERSNVGVDGRGLIFLTGSEDKVYIYIGGASWCHFI